jgi:hypothetical protein
MKFVGREAPSHHRRADERNVEELGISPD